ncbi:PIN domain nuclease [Microcoleus sp. LEGE 07076]|uniref:type II toxin-antitoxin system VapC family toxin n=1 Tax=Microcoleus sp. LEGE 07076 TaxID=915322 RepID=UPI00187E93AB|nr:PIN domain nuclease [Microcoleus sp. LEGE 07076]MBE9183507.1 PIN domain nuclease [Microcoleus sp. LEGE 07076]
MFLIDTSVWIGVFRDRTGVVRQSLEAIINNESIFLNRFTQMELLQGCRDEREWTLLETYLQEQDYIESTPNTWVAAARIYYDLQRQGLTVRSSIDCCIAQLAIEHQLILVHNDRDFETIQRVRSVNCLRFRPDS